MPAKRKPLEDWQLADAVRLKALFANRQDKVSQAEFASRHKFGETQGIVWQYLNGRIPLNIKALLKFSRALGVGPDEISPRLSQSLDQVPTVRPMLQQTLAIYVTEPERQKRLLELYDKLRREQQDEFLQRIEAAASANEAIVRELGPRFQIAPDEMVARHIRPAGAPVPRRRESVKKTKT